MIPAGPGFLIGLSVAVLLAAVVAWWLSRRRRGRSLRALVAPAQARPDPDLIAPLFALIDDDTDRALAGLLAQGAEQARHPEPLFALAIAYRRRGELDRAVTIHQALLARLDLSTGWRHRALLELGRDYLSLGWLDRAERLLEQAFEASENRQAAGRSLIRLQEMQRHWQRAEDWAVAISPNGLHDPGTRSLVANYRSARAEEHLSRHERIEAERWIRSALSLDRTHLHAWTLRLRWTAERGDRAATQAAVNEALRSQPEAVRLAWREIEPRITDCPDDEAALAWLSEVYRSLPAAEVALAVSRVHLARADVQAARAHLYAHLEAYPGIGGIEALEALRAEIGDRGPMPCLNAVRRILDRADMGRYVCDNCGLRTASWRWQCPRCFRWGGCRDM
ncbi:MAG: hypothetical protein ACLFSG_00720 [Halothiobacillaceae bacterium]